MNYLIIDDEPIARQGIKLLADQVSFLQYRGEYANPILAHPNIDDSIDLIFLDIEMPGLRGTDYLKTLAPKTKVILTTAYPQFALEAFELDVVDYLVKPIKISRFIKAVDKAKSLHGLVGKSAELSPSTSEVFIKSDRKFIKLSYSDILYIKGMKDYVVLHTNQKKYMTALNLSTISKQLPSQQFVRISKSYIVNVAHIDEVGLDYVSIRNEEVTLGKSYKEDFINRFVKTNLLKRG